MKRSLAILLVLLTPGLALAQASPPQLLQRPTVNKTHIVFAFADDLWIVPRAGGDAQRLTSGPGVETDPTFSPDGKWVAFTGEYEGNVDVYVMPAAGGQPRRLTYHPGLDRAVGWTPDGKKVLFYSQRNSYSRFGQLFTVPLEGGAAEQLPLPMADQGCYAPDGSRLAYVPLGLQTYAAWKRYRGGTTSAIWLADLSDSAVVRVPRDNSNDTYPMWIGDRVWFLSDRRGPTTLFSFDGKDNKIREAIVNDGLDFKSASAGPDCIALERFGSIHLFDLKSETARKVDIRVHADLPALRPKFVKVGKQLVGAGLSPTGARALFTARGEILTVPTKKGDVRNLSNSPGVAERDPAWSPDGKSIAYFSDQSGEYALHLRGQSGLGEVKKFTLGDAPAFYYSPRWSPDSKKIAYTDNRAKLWTIDLDTGKNVLVAANTYYDRSLDPSWSPDSQWLAYSKDLKNHLHAAFIHEIESGKSTQVTDGMSDVQDPCFDRSGKYLYFTASTDAGPTAGGIEMSNYNFPVTRSVYVVVLDKSLSSPLSPESDEEKAAEKKNKKPMDDADKKPADAPAMKIDFENIGQRILALPIPPRNYVDLSAGKAGVLFLLEAPVTPVGAAPAAGPFGRLELHRFDLAKRKLEPFAETSGRAILSADGEKVLYKSLNKWYSVSSATAPKPGEGSLRTDDIEVRVDPPAEWKQMYREVWRIERDFLYDPHFHGYDLKTAEKAFLPYLEGVASRRDLNYLFMQMLGELSLGHVYVRGGDLPDIKGPKGGLLGADYAIDKGRYKFARIYHGENWNPGLRAPLTQPGVNVQVGEYLLAVNGRDVAAPADVDQYLEATAGKSTVLRVGPSADGKGARTVTVVPVDSELALRNRAWIESNRRKVAEMTGGKIAYVYLPDTAVGGYTNFNRYFFAQTDKDGVIIDERFNGGGKAADYIIERLGRPLSNYWSTRYGADYTTPAGAIFGPKVMIINEQAGSGGDYLPWAFRRAKLGPIVGKRTWGGLVGIGGYPSLIDGGMVTAPHFAFWTPEGKWEVENRGVPPDIEVEYDPKAVREGHDPQLEKAVQLALDMLAKNPTKRPTRPAYPDYHKKPAAPPRGAVLRTSLQLDAPKAGAPAISIERIRGAVKYLAGDELQGRGVGSRGEELATDFIARQFAKAGLKPAGERGTFFQAVPLVMVATGPKATLTAVNGDQKIAFQLRDDFAGLCNTQQSEDFDAEAIFLGHAITAPEFGWNDYKDVDVKGKVVVCFTNEPPSDDPKFFGGKALTYYGRWTYKYEEAARRGAKAVLIIHTNETAGYPYSVVKKLKGAQIQRTPDSPALAFAGWLSAPAGDKLLASIGLTVDEALKKANTRGFKAIPLGVRIQGHIPTSVQKIVTKNVIGMVEGTDAALKSEAVMFTAHWDHLGVGKSAVGTNDIYYGALDNATGCAVLLEMARLWAGQQPRPKRSAIFLATTAEESGLLGATYYASHPTLPLGKTAIDLNFDTVLPLGVPESVVVSGAGRTTAWPLVQQAARKHKLDIEPDKMAHLGFYYRSDHFALARGGVPAFSVFPGEKIKGKPADFARKAMDEYIARVYHTPFDAYHADWDFSGYPVLMQFAFDVARAAANANSLPTWVPGDEFLRTRQKSGVK
jgi:tricorn protease